MPPWKGGGKTRQFLRWTNRKITKTFYCYNTRWDDKIKHSCIGHKAHEQKNTTSISDWILPLPHTFHWKHFFIKKNVRLNENCQNSKLAGMKGWQRERAWYIVHSAFNTLNRSEHVYFTWFCHQRDLVSSERILGTIIYLVFTINDWDMFLLLRDNIFTLCLLWRIYVENYIPPCKK